MSPQRIQRSRAKGWRMPAGARYVGRPSVWGNPYVVVRTGKTQWDVCGPYSYSSLATFHSRTGAEARADAVERFNLLIEHNRDPWGVDRIRSELQGLDLMCWCPLDQPCHADVLLGLANRPEGDTL